MPVYRIPIELDLRPHPAHPAEVAVEVDLPLLAAHAGNKGPLALDRVGARFTDGRSVPAQCLHNREGAQVVLRLPADVAAQDGALVALEVATEEAAPAATSGAPRVVFSQEQDTVELRVDNARFALYRYNTADPELPRPYFHPIVGPTGVPITQEGEIPGTKQAHFHHTGLVLAHQNFTEGNNWQIGPQHSRMRHLGFDVMQSGPLLGRFVQRLECLNVKGTRAVFRETRSVTVGARPPQRRYLDVDTTITCGDEPATWNATPYHLLAIRVPDAMTVAHGGAITNSEGQRNPADGIPARWLDFSGPLSGLCGVALFDHPQNLRHPTPWLNFENETVGAAPTHREPYAWKPGGSLRFRYRVYLHEGDVEQGRVAEEYAAYTAAVKARIGAPSLIG